MRKEEQRPDPECQEMGWLASKAADPHLFLFRSGLQKYTGIYQLRIFLSEVQGLPFGFKNSGLQPWRG